MTHGGEVEGGWWFLRRSRFKFARRENHLADLSDWALAALRRHIPQKVTLNSSLAHKSRGDSGRKEGCTRSITSALDVRCDKETVPDTGRFTSMEHVWTSVAKTVTGYKRCVKPQCHVGAQSTINNVTLVDYTVYCEFFPFLFFKMLLAYTSCQ